MTGWEQTEEREQRQQESPEQREMAELGMPSFLPCRQFYINERDPQKLKMLEGSYDLMTSFNGIPPPLQTALFCECTIEFYVSFVAHGVFSVRTPLGKL